jgi:predicted AAA+ superfamily ATPase
MFIGRKEILAKIKKWENDHKIKILIGLRRVGKTTVLLEYKKTINNSNSNIIQYDFNDASIG